MTDFGSLVYLGKERWFCFCAILKSLIQLPYRDLDTCFRHNHKTHCIILAGGDAAVGLRYTRQQALRFKEGYLPNYRKLALKSNRKIEDKRKKTRNVQQ